MKVLKSGILLKSLNLIKYHKYKISSENWIQKKDGKLKSERNKNLATVGYWSNSLINKLQKLILV